MRIREDVGEELEDDERLGDLDGVCGRRLSWLYLGSAVDEVGDLARDSSVRGDIEGVREQRTLASPG